MPTPKMERQKKRNRVFCVFFFFLKKEGKKKRKRKSAASGWKRVIYECREILNYFNDEYFLTH